MASCNISGDGIVTRAYIRLSHPRLTEGKAFISLIACNRDQAIKYIMEYGPRLEEEEPMKLLWNPPTDKSPVIKCQGCGNSSLVAIVKEAQGCPICGGTSFKDDVVRRFVKPGASAEEIRGVLALYPFMG